MNRASASRLRHRITIEERVEIYDSETNDESFTWQTAFENVAADYVPLSGREFVAANAIQSKVTGRFKIRERHGVMAKQRIVFRGQYFNIEAVLPDEDSGREFLWLPVTQGVNNG